MPRKTKIPIVFHRFALQNLQHGVEVSRSDKYLIEALISDFKMKPEVVNVLIEYVLKMKNQQFPKAYVEKVASTWVRLEIDTSEKALAHIQRETEEKGSRRKPVQKKSCRPGITIRRKSRWMWKILMKMSCCRR